MKRFTETTKWEDPWFSELPLKYKVFWFYICDKCDNSGVWVANLKLASFMIGEDIKVEEVKKLFNKDNERIHFFGSKWLILKFVDFQFGTVSPLSNMGKNVIKLMETNISKGVKYPSNTLRTAVRQGIGKGKGKGKSKSKGNLKIYKKPSLEEIKDYIKEKNYNVNPKIFYDYFTTSDWVDSKGNKVKNWKQKLVTWNSYGGNNGKAKTQINEGREDKFKGLETEV